MATTHLHPLSQLGLPPEIFEIIIRELVKQEGPKGAWKLREVCSTFSKAITHEIFAQQPQDAFASVGSKKIMRRKFWLYLFNGTLLPRDANPEILDAINAMIEYLRKNSSKASALDEKILREIICKAVSKTVRMHELGFGGGFWYEEDIHEPVLDYTWFYTRHARGIFDANGSINVQCLLAAATAINDDLLLKEVLTQLQQSCDYGKSMFGDILTNSLSFNRPEMLAIFSDHVDGLQIAGLPEFAGFSNCPWDKVVIQALKMKSDPWVERLLQFASKYCRRTQTTGVTYFPQVLHFAIENCDSAALIHFLDFGSGLAGTSFSLDVGDFEYICAEHNEHVVLRMAKLLSPDIDYIWRNSTTLTLAVKHGTASAVAALLDAGARVDGRSANCHIRSSKIRKIVVPIDEAIKRGKTSIIKVLLDHNADIKHVKVSHRTKAVYNMLREAKMKQTGKHLPTYDEEKFDRIKRKIPIVQSQPPAVVPGQEAPAPQAPPVPPYRQHTIVQSQLALPEYNPPAIAIHGADSSFMDEGSYAGARNDTSYNDARTFPDSSIEDITWQNPFVQPPSALPGYHLSTTDPRQIVPTYMFNSANKEDGYYLGSDLELFYPPLSNDQVTKHDPFGQQQSGFLAQLHSGHQSPSAYLGSRHSGSQSSSALLPFQHPAPASRRFTPSSMPPAGSLSVHPGHSQSDNIQPGNAHSEAAPHQLPASYTDTAIYGGGSDHAFNVAATAHQDNGFVPIPGAEATENECDLFGFLDWMVEEDRDAA